MASADDDAELFTRFCRAASSTIMPHYIERRHVAIAFCTPTRFALAFRLTPHFHARHFRYAARSKYSNNRMIISLLSLILYTTIAYARHTFSFRAIIISPIFFVIGHQRASRASPPMGAYILH